MNQHTERTVDLSLLFELNGVRVQRRASDTITASVCEAVLELNGFYSYGMGRMAENESVQVLKEVHARIQTYLALRPGPLQGSDPLFATTACHDRGGNVLTAAGKRLSTRAIHRIITDGLLLAGVKKPGIVVHSLRHSTPTFALLNDANPTRVQKMMRHKHYATTEIYVEEVQKLLEGAEEAVTQI